MHKKQTSQRKLSEDQEHMHFILCWCLLFFFGFFTFFFPSSFRFFFRHLCMLSCRLWFQNRIRIRTYSKVKWFPARTFISSTKIFIAILVLYVAVFLSFFPFSDLFSLTWLLLTIRHTSNSIQHFICVGYIRSVKWKKKKSNRLFRIHKIGKQQTSTAKDRKRSQNRMEKEKEEKKIRWKFVQDKPICMRAFEHKMILCVICVS